MLQCCKTNRLISWQWTCLLFFLFLAMVEQIIAGNRCQRIWGLKICRQFLEMEPAVVWDKAALRTSIWQMSRIDKKTCCLFSPLRSQIRVVLGQHHFNVTSPNTRSFEVEEYIFPKKFSAFNPTLHDIGMKTFLHTHTHVQVTHEQAKTHIYSIPQSVCTAVSPWTAVFLCTSTYPHTYTAMQFVVGFSLSSRMSVIT